MIGWVIGLAPFGARFDNKGTFAEAVRSQTHVFFLGSEPWLSFFHDNDTFHEKVPPSAKVRAAEPGFAGFLGHKTYSGWLIRPNGPFYP